MIAFIVAKDEDEFKRYKRGMLRHDKELEINGNAGSKIGDAIVRSIGLDGNGKLCVLLILLIDKDRVKANLNRDALKDVKNFLSNLKRTVFVLKSKEGEITKEIATFCEKAIRVDGTVAKCIAEETVLFVHWGGGAPLEYERQFNILLGQHLEDKDSAQFTQIRAYAFSSRRAELFDVTRSKIETPKTYDELVELENRFRNAQVDEAFSHCAAKHEQNIFGAKKEIIDRLDRFAIRVLKSSLDTEKKEGLLQSVAKAKSEELVNAKYTSDDTAAFFAKILNKEVFNG